MSRRSIGVIRLCLIGLFFTLLFCFPFCAFAFTEDVALDSNTGEPLLPDESTMETAKQVKLQMALPKDISVTGFSEKTYVKLQEGGVSSNVELTGVPFLYKNQAYVPVRDIVEAFNIRVEYNETDRFVVLRSDSHTIFIPSRLMNVGMGFSKPPLYRAAMYKGDKAFRQEEAAGEPLLGCSYLTFNDRSYVPMRDLVEFFDFDVYYDEKQKTIAIEGTRMTHSEAKTLFSEDQEKIISAFASYDGATHLSYENITGMSFIGANDYGGGDVVSAVQTRETDPDAAGKLIRYSLTASDGEKYETRYWNGNLQIEGKTYPIDTGKAGSVARMLPSGEKAYLNMRGTGLHHPLIVLDVGGTLLSGCNKYKEMDISKLGETATTETYLITMLDNVEIDVEVEIDKATGKLCRYKEAADSKPPYYEETAQGFYELHKPSPGKAWTVRY